nr:Elongation factor 1-beta 1 [Ipomoea batatas]
MSRLQHSQAAASSDQRPSWPIRGSSDAMESSNPNEQTQVHDIREYDLDEMLELKNHAVSTKLAASFPGKAVGVRIGCQDAPAEAAPAKVVPNCIFFYLLIYVIINVLFLCIYCFFKHD